MKKYLILIALLAVIGVASVALANPSFFAVNYTSSTATSSPTSISAISSLTMPITGYYDNFDSAGNTYKADSLTLLTQTISSTSAAVVKVRVQYSMDAIDWFENNLATTSTANLVELKDYVSYQITGNTTSSTTRQAININVPTRYVRVLYTATTGTSTVWSQLIPIKQSK